MLRATGKLEQNLDRFSLMAFKPQYYFTIQSNTCFSLLHPAPHIPPQCLWQGGHFWCSLMEEAFLEGDIGSCHPHFFSISSGFQQSEFTMFGSSVSEYLVYLVCFHWCIKTQAHYQHIFTPADGWFFLLPDQIIFLFYKRHHSSIVKGQLQQSLFCPFYPYLSFFLFQDSYGFPKRFLGACRHYSPKFWSVQLVLLKRFKNKISPPR